MTVPALGSGRSVLLFAVLTAVAGIAMLPALNTLSDAGTSIWELEHTPDSGEMATLEEGLSGDAHQAAYVQLFVDIPFLIGYGGLIAALCLWTATIVERRGWKTQAGILTLAAALGPLAAALDLTQNAALLFILGGHTGQPWPRISDLAGYATFTAAVLALLLVAGLLAAALARRRSHVQ